MKYKKPLKTNDKRVYGNNYTAHKKNNGLPKGPKNAGAAQKRAMTPKNVAAKY